MGVLCPLSLLRQPRAGAAFLPERPSSAVAAAADHADRNSVAIREDDVEISGTHAPNGTIQSLKLAG